MSYDLYTFDSKVFDHTQHSVTLRSVGVSPGANSTSCVIVKPAGLAVGDLMIAQDVTVDSGEDVTPPANWTLIRADAYSTTVKSHLFWKIAVQADVDATNFTFTTVNTRINRGAISAWIAGTFDPTTPINANNGQGNAGSTTVTSPAITPSVANCMILMVCGIRDDNTQSAYAIATSNPASWTEAYDLLYTMSPGTDLALALGYALRPETSSTGNGTATTSGSSDNIGQLVAIAPLVAGTNWTLDLSDTITIGESIGKTTGKVAADTLNLSDAIYKLFSLNKSDTISPTDNFSRAVEYYRTLTDTLSLADALSKEMGLSQSDSLSLTDSLVKTIGLGKSDTLSILDNFTRTVEYFKGLSDTLNLSDALAKEIRLAKSDSLTLSDSLAKEIGLFKSDTLTLSDEIGLLYLWFKLILRAHKANLTLQEHTKNLTLLAQKSALTSQPSLDELDLMPDEDDLTLRGEY